MPAKEREYKGNHLLVLGSLPGTKYPFQFGVKKAVMILENLDDIKFFIEKHRKEGKDSSKEGKDSSKEGKDSSKEGTATLVGFPYR